MYPKRALGTTEGNSLSSVFETVQKNDHRASYSRYRTTVCFSTHLTTVFHKHCDISFNTLDLIETYKSSAKFDYRHKEKRDSERIKLLSMFQSGKFKYLKTIRVISYAVIKKFAS